MTAVTASAGRQARVIGLIGTAHFFSHFYYLAFPPMFPLIKADLGVSNIELGLAMTAYNVATAVLQTPVGLLVDRIGARRLLIAGLFINAIAIIGAGLVTTYWGLLALLAVAGAANSVFHPADYAILSASVDKTRIGRAFSLHSFGGTSGFAAAPLVMFALASVWDWRTALVIVGAAGIVLAGIVTTLSGALQDHSFDADADAGRRDPDARTGWRALMTRPILVFFTFFVLLAAAGSGLTTFAVVALMEVYGVELITANGALTAFLVMVAAGVLIGGYVADKTQKHDLVLYVTYGVSGLCLVLVATTLLPFWLVVGVFLVAGLARGIVNPTRDVMVRAVAPPGAVGATFGFVTTGFTIGQSFAPVMYGWLMDVGSPASVFWLAAGFTALAIILVATMHEKSS